MSIDFQSGQDERYPDPKPYLDENNPLMATFLSGWGDRRKQGGGSTWDNSGGYCRRQFQPREDGTWTSHERRLVYLGLLVAFVNGDRCAHWTDEQREQALKNAHEYIWKQRPQIAEGD